MLDIGGALILVLGVALKHPEAVLEEATPKYDFNPELDAALAQQMADARVGAVLLAVGFTVQFVSALGVREDGWGLASLAIASAAVAVLGAWGLLKWYRRECIRDVIYARLPGSDGSFDACVWESALCSFGRLLGQPWRGPGDEPLEEYAIRLIGKRRWNKRRSKALRADVS